MSNRYVTRSRKDFAKRLIFVQIEMIGRAGHDDNRGGVKVKRTWVIEI